MGDSAYIRPRASIARNESGAVFVTTLLLILLLTAIGNATLNTSIIETMISSNYHNTTDTLFVAEAGLQHGKGVLNSVDGADNGFDDELGTTIASSTDFAGGTYTVTAEDNDDGDSDLTADDDSTIVLTSTGTKNEGTRTIVAVVFRRPFTAPGAITTECNFEISGNPTITGALGSVHANCNLDISGSPVISQTASSSGSTIVSGDVSAVGGGVTSGADPVYIPPVIPSDFQSYADYTLQSDGKIMRMSDGAIVHDAVVDGLWDSWDYGVTKWTQTGANPNDGMFYVEGDLIVSSNPPNWSTSLLATGSIELGGVPNIQNYKDPSDPVGVQNLLFIAGNDLKINGDGSQSFEGIMAAGEQLQLSGNPSLDGFIIVGEQSNLDGTVAESNLSGNMDLFYNGNMDSPWDGNTVSIKSWREEHNL